LKNQKDIDNGNRMLFIVCDGRVKGPESDMTTDKILKEMFKDDIKETVYFENAYTTWSGEKNNVEVGYS